MGSGFKVFYSGEKIFKKKFCHEDLQNNSTTATSKTDQMLFWLCVKLTTQYFHDD